MSRISLQGILKSNPGSIEPLDRIIAVCTDIVYRLFGEMGRQEFRMEDFDYDRESNRWKVKLTRRINDFTLNYEIDIDNDTGAPVGFRVIRDH